MRQKVMSSFKGLSLLQQVKALCETDPLPPAPVKRIKMSSILSSLHSDSFTVGQIKLPIICPRVLIIHIRKIQGFIFTHITSPLSS